jgi:hypothetical protein
MQNVTTTKYNIAHSYTYMNIVGECYKRLVVTRLTEKAVTGVCQNPPFTLLTKTTRIWHNYTICYNYSQMPVVRNTTIVCFYPPIYTKSIDYIQ